MPLYAKTIGILSILFMIVGCTGGAAVSPGPELGITADPELKVVAVYPGSAAEKAGVQIGDILVDLTWIPTDEAPKNWLGRLNDTLATLNGISPLPTPRVRPSDYMVKEPVPFTNIRETISLVGSGFPLNLRVIRNGEEVTIVITPTVRVRNYGPDNPAPTRVPEDWYGY